VLVGLFGILVVSALYLLVNSASRTIGRQRERLAANLAASRRLSEENLALRDAADHLRLSANSANEALLAQVGSDIHDGPLQLLTLIILRLSRRAEGADLAPTIQLASETMEELRNISTGLVLPELAETTLEQALALAVQRHEEQTGTAVERVFGELAGPVTLAVKIAAYRVVQEALTNAFRHGGGMGQVVEATIESGTLLLTIENEATGNPPSATDRSDMRLGLKGMRFRVESLGGELNIAFGAEHTRVSANIPLGADRTYA
jgi:signal transduction histidine kinase